MIESIYVAENFPYVGSGPYAFTFEFLEADDLEILLLRNDGGLIVLGPRSFTVTSLGAVVDRKYQGGEITLDIDPLLDPELQSVAIGRRTDRTQLTDYVEGRPFPAATHEFNLDKLTMITQEQDQQLDFLRGIVIDGGGGGGTPGGPFIPLSGTLLSQPVTGNVNWQIDSFATFGLNDPGDGSQWSIGVASDLALQNRLLFLNDVDLGQPPAFRSVVFSVCDSTTLRKINFIADGTVTAGRPDIPDITPEHLITKQYFDDNIGSGGGGEVNTSSDAGTGVGLTLPKDGQDLPFKSLVAGANITLTDNGNDITVTASGAGGGGDLPPGALNQILANDDGASVYSARTSVRVNNIGMAIGPDTVDPLVTLQVDGTATFLNGGTINLNNADNSSTAILEYDANNRMSVTSGIANGVDLKGTGSAALRVFGDGLLLMNVGGGVGNRRVSLRYEDEDRFRTDERGVRVFGTVICDPPAAGSEAVTLDYANANFISGTELNNYVLKSGDVMTGNLEVQAAISTGSINALGNVEGANVISRRSATGVWASDYCITKGFADINYVRLSGGGNQSVSGNLTVAGALTTNNNLRAANVYPQNGNGVGFIGTNSLRWNSISLVNQPNVSSDIAFKRDICDLTGDLIDALIPRIYTRRDTGEREMGFVAQEVEKVQGDVALVSGDEGEKGLQYGQIIAALVAKVQSLESRLATLEA